MRIREVLAGLGVVMLSSAANAGIIYSVENEGVHATQVVGATTVDFNDMTCGAYSVCSGGKIVSGNSPGVYASPHGINDGINDRYLTVGNGTASLSLASSYDYFGLYWGSADNYNYLSFYLKDALVKTFGGAELAPLMASGHQTSYDANRFVNFYFNDGSLFDRVDLISNGYAFESDNHAFASSVPEPGTLTLLGVGVASLLWGRRKRAAAQAQS